MADHNTLPDGSLPPFGEENPRPEVLAAVDELVDMLSWAASTKDRASVWLSHRDLGDGTVSGRTILAEMHARGWIERRSRNRRTGKKADWVCRLRKSVVIGISEGKALPWLSPETRKLVPSKADLGALYASI